jgi:cytochrome P450
LLYAAGLALRIAPRPPSLPLVGNLADVGIGKIAAGFAKPPHVRMAELAAECGGEDVMELQMGAEVWTVLSSPRAVHEAFILRGGDFAGRPMVPSMAVSAGGGQGFSQSAPDAALRALRRAAFGTLFSPTEVARARDDFDDEAAALVRHLLAVGDVQLRPALRRCVSNMVLRYTFGMRVPHESEPPTNGAVDPRARELVRTADAIWEQLTSPVITAADLIAPALAPAAHGPLRALVARRDALLRELIDERLAARATGAGAGARSGDMLERLLDAGLTDSQVAYSLVDLFIAGVNTVATALEWLLLLTARHTFAQGTARAEAADGSGEMRYVRALLDETLRYKPPLLLPRQAVRDTQVCGVGVPSGRVVFANSYALCFQKEAWRVPSGFRPSRWLEEERALFAPAEQSGSASGSAEARCKFLPFSVGQRACPGEVLARAELEAVTLALLRGLRWEAVGTVDLREEYSLTLVPAKAQSLRFKPLA